MSTPLDGFDFSVLADPEFKEDSVREEIIAPLLRALGFAAHGPARIRRSVPLAHPYVSIGSNSKKINIFPDYLLCVDDGRIVCALDAKAPSESVSDAHHLSQAYTYAIHRDVQASHYALCNGRDFVLFRVADMSPTPTFAFQIAELPVRWPEVQSKLSPHVLAADGHSGKMNKDFGQHLERLGLRHDMKLFFPGVPVYRLGRVGKDLYSLMAALDVDGGPYAASFDFGPRQLEELLGFLPPRFSATLKKSFERWPVLVNVGTDGPPILVNVHARPGSELIENKDEIYRPLVVTEFV